MDARIETRGRRGLQRDIALGTSLGATMGGVLAVRLYIDNHRSAGGCLYGGVFLAKPDGPGTLPFWFGLVVALFATPIWYAVVRSDRSLQKDLHDAAGVAYEPPAPSLDSSHRFTVYRSTRTGGSRRIGEFWTRERAEAQIDHLSHLPHEYWIEERDAGAPSSGEASGPPLERGRGDPP